MIVFSSNICQYSSIIGCDMLFTKLNLQCFFIVYNCYSKDVSLENFFNLKKKENYLNRLNNIGISEECFKFQLELYKDQI